MRNFQLSRFLCILCFGCTVVLHAQTNVTLLRSVAQPVTNAVVVEKDIKIKDYFEYMDALVAAQDTSHEFVLTEHLLVHRNPWLIERLAETDYYRQMDRQKFVQDQKQWVVLRRGDTLHLPKPEEAWSILESLRNTRLDLNIPEYKLRILRGQDTLFSILVRVGQRADRYLETAGKEVDLRTQTGKGKIVAVNKKPDWINPVDGHQYTATRRDDGKVTACPRIPWLEPEIDGERFGQFIHPTTNPSTLGKVYSNGCIGMGEADAWYAYYYAPIGTPVEIRYDLEVPSPDGTLIQLPDIYGKNEGRIGAFKVIRGQVAPN